MRLLKKTALLFLVFAIALCSLTSCANDRAAISFRDSSLSESDYAFLLAFVKGYYEYNYSYMAQYYGTEFSMDDLYDVDVGDGMTFADALNDAVLETAKMVLVVEQLCKEANLTVTDADSISEIDSIMQELEDAYGGRDAFDIQLAKLGLKRDSIERYEYYNALLGLLQEYRYGENGVARISETEVRNNFNEDYFKAEGYFYAYSTSSSSTSATPYEYDFASDYSDEAVETFFLSNMLIDYVAFAEESDAQDAYTKLSSGESVLSDFYDICEKRSESKFITQRDVSETIYEGLQTSVPGSWYLSGDEDGSYYVIYLHEITAESLDDEIESSVRDAMVVEDAYAYFLENYVTVRHILYTDEGTANQVYADLLAGKTTFAEHEDETADSGVQYTFADNGTMVDEFADAAFETEIGGYALVKTDYGWHVIYRAELDTSAFDSADAVASMSQVYLMELAEEQYAAISAGGKYTEPGEDDLFQYSEAALLAYADQDERLQEAFQNAETGETILLEMKDYGIFVLTKLETNDEDLEEVYEDIEDTLVKTAFYEYLQTYFDSITVDETILANFNVRTAETFYY